MSRPVAAAFALAELVLVIVGAIVIARPGPDTVGEWILGVGVVGMIVQALVSLIAPRDRGDRSDRRDQGDDRVS